MVEGGDKRWSKALWNQLPQEQPIGTFVHNPTRGQTSSVSYGWLVLQPAWYEQSQQQTTHWNAPSSLDALHPTGARFLNTAMQKQYRAQLP